MATTTRDDRRIAMFSKLQDPRNEAAIPGDDPLEDC
jgi:hypothetical protein